MTLLLLFVGCIYVPSSESAWHDSGTSSCDTEYDCPDGHGCLDGWCARACDSDAQCPGDYACSDPGPTTDALGCVERCATDWDCKAGSRCSTAGACE